MKICIVSSCGGHLTEIRCLKSAYEKYEHFYVLNDKAVLPQDMRNSTYFIAHSERDLKFLVNIWEAFKILSKERPDIILSAGAGPVVPFAIIGRLLYKTHVLYIETITQVITPSLTGRIMRWLANKTFYQWKSLSRYFPDGVYGGPLF